MLLLRRLFSVNFSLHKLCISCDIIFPKYEICFRRTAEKLKSRLDSDDNLTEDMKTKARSNLIIVTNDVKKAKDNLEKEKIKNILAKRSWDKVRQGRMYFTVWNLNL